MLVRADVCLSVCLYVTNLVSSVTQEPIGLESPNFTQMFSWVRTGAPPIFRCYLPLNFWVISPFLTKFAQNMAKSVSPLSQKPMEVESWNFTRASGKVWNGAPPIFGRDNSNRFRIISPWKLDIFMKKIPLYYWMYIPNWYT